MSDPGIYKKDLQLWFQQTTWDNVHLCYGIVIRTLNISVPGNKFRTCTYLVATKLEIQFISVLDNYMKNWTSLFEANFWDIVYMWYQQLHVTLYINFPKNSWEILHFCSQQYSNTMCISGPDKFLRHYTFLVPATSWDIVNLWSQQILNSLYILGSTNYTRHWTFLVPTATWNTVHLWTHHLLETTNIYGHINYMSHGISMVPQEIWGTEYFSPATICDKVHLCFQLLHEKINISSPAPIWGTVFRWFL